MDTPTIGKREACVAGGVKTGILDTHTIVWPTYEHTDDMQTEACVAGGVKTGILETHTIV